jgi:hypothetical protein
MLKASFWIDLGERTLRAFAQGALGGFGVGATVLPVTGLPWMLALQMGGSMAVLCFLTGLAGGWTGDKQTASFLPPPDQTPQLMRALAHPLHREDDKHGSSE